MFSLFSDVPEIPSEPVFILSQNYAADPSPLKVDLGIGAYRDENGEQTLLQVVAKVERGLVQKAKQYLPIGGLKEFCHHSVCMLYGNDAPIERIASLQTISGTGALRIAVDFCVHLRRNQMQQTSSSSQKEEIPQVEQQQHISSWGYVSDPTWPNHRLILSRAGVENVSTYRYITMDDAATIYEIDYDGFVEDILNAPIGSLFIFHCCAHNPTGIDPTPTQWDRIADIFANERKDLVAIFDVAYQGFATGDFDQDAYAVRSFLRFGVDYFFSCQSYSKSMGLYGERVGCLSMICPTVEAARACQSQLVMCARPSYGNPPTHGVEIAQTILTTPTLTSEWREELEGMRCRIEHNRTAFVEALQRAVGGPAPHWLTHIQKQRGMFAYLPFILSPEMCEVLSVRYHIYMTSTARISLAGLNEGNIPYVAASIIKVLDEAI